MIKPPMTTSGPQPKEASPTPAPRTAQRLAPGDESARGEASSFREAIERSGMLAAAGRGSASSTEDENSARTEILDEGFQAYAERIRQENLERMREKILNSMGLSEDDLSRMPPEQREAIEDMVAKELERRMMALAELNDGQSTRTGMMAGVSRHDTATHVSATATSVDMSRGMDGRAAATGASSSGLGPLLALQEIELARAEAGRDGAGEPGKNDRVGRDERS